MQVTINGQPRDLPEALTLRAMLAMLGIPDGTVAIERNLEIVPASAYDAVRIAPGDRLEIVHFVGGGA